jgi:hypothetical protein
MSEPVTVEYAPVWARILPVAATASGFAISRTSEAVVGLALEETTGAASARAELIDGQDANGVSGIPITLSPGQSVRDDFGGLCLRFTRGVFLNVTSGTVHGSVWVADVGSED